MLADGLPKGWVVRYDGGMERLRPYVWWVIPTLGVAAILGIVVGYPLVWLGCAAFNILGVWLFCDSKGSQHEKQQTWMKALTIALVPVGVVGVFASGGGSGGSGHTPSEAASLGSDDDTTREESARAASKAVGGGTGLRP